MLGCRVERQVRHGWVVVKVQGGNDPQEVGFNLAFPVDEADGVAEHVVRPARVAGRRRDAQPRVVEPKVVAVERAQHEAVRGGPDGAVVGVFGGVDDPDMGHGGLGNPR